MVPERLDDVRRRAERQYELGRAKLALMAVGPLAVCLAVAAFVRGANLTLTVLGAALVLVGATAVWRGQASGRALLPGLGAGLLPVLAANAWMQLGHHCVGESCMTWCAPICGSAGLVGGALVAYISWRRKDPSSAVALAGVVSLLAASVGCVHLGSSTVLAIAVGLLGGLLATRLVTARAS